MHLWEEEGGISKKAIAKAFKEEHQPPLVAHDTAPYITPRNFFDSRE